MNTGVIITPASDISHADGVPHSVNTKTQQRLLPLLREPGCKRNLKCLFELNSI